MAPFYGWGSTASRLQPLIVLLNFLSGSSRICTWGTVFQYVYKRFIPVDMIDINKVSGL